MTRNDHAARPPEEVSAAGPELTLAQLVTRLQRVAADGDLYARFRPRKGRVAEHAVIDVWAVGGSIILDTTGGRRKGSPSEMPQ